MNDNYDWKAPDLSGPSWVDYIRPLSSKTLRQYEGVNVSPMEDTGIRIFADRVWNDYE